jgi:hypothetical protein
MCSLQNVFSICGQGLQDSRPWQHLCQKRPTQASKETYTSVKRDLHTCGQGLEDSPPWQRLPVLPDCCRASHFLSSVCEKQSLGFSVVLGLRFGALEHVCVCVCVCMCVLKVRVSAACNARWRARESLSPL